MVPKLDIQNIRFEYYDPRLKQGLLALDGVSFSIAPGEFVSVVGPSGCGKSTLLLLIDGLVPPNDGEILIDGVSVEPNKRSDIGMVFQFPSLLPWRNVLRNVTYGLEIQGRSKSEAEQAAKEYISLVGLAHFEKYFPHQLSGGMQQRVNLARALTLNPQILLMDEPLAALDAQTRELMQSELLRIWQATQKTVLFVTHQIDEAVFLSDRVVVISSRPGKVKGIIDVGLPRPRTMNMRTSDQFLSCVNQIWKMIELEARQVLEMKDQIFAEPQSIREKGKKGTSPKTSATSTQLVSR